MNRREACAAAGRNSMFVVNLIKRYKKEGHSHAVSHLKALYQLRFKRLDEGKNTKYVDSAIERAAKWI